MRISKSKLNRIPIYDMVSIVKVIGFWKTSSADYDEVDAKNEIIFSETVDGYSINVEEHTYNRKKQLRYTIRTIDPLVTFMHKMIDDNELGRALLKHKAYVKGIKKLLDIVQELS